MVLDILGPRFFVDPNTVFHGPTVHHQQRHDGVIVRRGRQFNLPVGGEFAVHGQHVAHVFVLRIQDIGQVGERVIAVLHEQGDETLVSVAGIVVPLNVVRRELVEVPQDLEVKEILRRK